MGFFDWNGNGRDDLFDDMMDYHICNDSSGGKGNNNHGNIFSLGKIILTITTIMFFGLLSLAIGGKRRQKGIGVLGLGALGLTYVMIGLGIMSISPVGALCATLVANVASGVKMKDKISSNSANIVEKLSGRSASSRERSSNGESKARGGEKVGRESTSNGESKVGGEEKIGSKNDSRSETQVGGKEKVSSQSSLNNESKAGSKKNDNNENREGNEKIKKENKPISENTIREEKSISTIVENNHVQENNHMHEKSIHKKKKETKLHQYEIASYVEEYTEECGSNMEYYDTVESALKVLKITSDYKKIMVERIKGKKVKESPAVMWKENGKLYVYPLIKGENKYSWIISDIKCIRFQKRINPDMDKEFYNVGISKIIDEYEELLPSYPFGEEGVYTWKYVVDGGLEVTNTSGEALFDVLGEESKEIRKQKEIYKEIGMFS